ncbi:heme/hemin ABC transporter substrate-binding protein [Lutibaculum baratangense]|uniref:Periplasmic hemin-binding protein n=1 Tax=Lutibaculum baratangense AMV1 TaxID=631454 RepID=V4RCN5_9HYPH|nr:ABC transporter substrate-binding protein [Lutibaculum baratangense]ESR23891.1 Periplasmic hemin-binding protein [Lutibaculum baratangense AMV1]
MRPKHKARRAALAGILLAATLTSGADRAAAAERIVSLGGSITEILYALGREGEIVAVDTTSQYPPAVTETHPDVGYLRALSAEGVLSVGPTLILAEADAGPQEAVALLEQASIAFRRAPDEPSAEGLGDKILFVARAVGDEAAGTGLRETVEADLETILGATGAIEPRARVLFVLSAAGGRIMASGANTAAASMIELAGAENAVGGFEGYKQINDEAVLAAAPDVIVMMAGGPHMPANEEVLSLPALADTPAGRARRLVTMDGLYLLGFGPRTAHAVRDLAHAIYPDLGLPDLPERPWTAAGGNGG